jgi:hypothetical protein
MTKQSTTAPAGGVKIYLSGGISSRTKQEYERHFAGVGRTLQAKGYDVVSPLDNGLPADAGWATHMRADLRMLTYCDEIFMLAGWERSAGATAEHSIAAALGMAIHYEEKPRNGAIKQAILAALNIPFWQICQRGRRRATVYARFIYAHFARRAGDTIITIANEMTHTHSNVSYYLRRYNNELTYNPEFRRAVKAVMDALKAGAVGAELATRADINDPDAEGADDQQPEQPDNTNNINNINTTKQ